MCGFAIASGVGPLVDAGPYAAPIFATVRAIAPWEAWAVAWCAVATLAALTVATRQAWAWRWAIVGCIAIGGTWVVGVSWEHWIDGAPVSPTGLALWCWFLITNLIAATSRHQFEGSE